MNGKFLFISQHMVDGGYSLKEKKLINGYNLTVLKPAKNLQKVYEENKCLIMKKINYEKDT